MNEDFYFVIARPWDKDKPEILCIYTYFNELHRGNMKEAQALLAQVKSRKHILGEAHDQYSIYKVSLEKVE